MRVDEMHSTDPAVRRLYHDRFYNETAFGNLDTHRRHSIDLLLHFYPTMTREAQERAKKTIQNLEKQLLERVK